MLTSETLQLATPGQTSRSRPSASTGTSARDISMSCSTPTRSNPTKTAFATTERCGTLSHDAFPLTGVFRVTVPGAPNSIRLSHSGPAALRFEAPNFYPVTCRTGYELEPGTVNATSELSVHGPVVRRPGATGRRATTCIVPSQVWLDSAHEEDPG